MGYTHYWRQKRDFTDQEWSEIKEKAKDILAAFEKSGGKLSADSYQEPPPHWVRFNGSPGCEQFILNEHKAEHFFYGWMTLEEYNENGAFYFCKTRQLPYDFAVVGVLRAAKRVAPDAITLSSDGDVFNDLEEGK